MFKCARCGEDYENLNSNERFPAYSIWERTGLYKHYEIVHLCPECWRELCKTLHEFLSGRKA